MSNNRKIIQLYSIKDFAEHKGVATSTVHDWLNSGKMVSYKTPKGKTYVNPFDAPESK